MRHFYSLLIALLSLLSFSSNSSAQSCVVPEVQEFPCNTTNYLLDDINDTLCIEQEANSVEYNFPDSESSCRAHDPQWFSFTPYTREINISVYSYDCTGGGESIQFAIYKGEPVCDQNVEGLTILPEFNCLGYAAYEIHFIRNISVQIGEEYYFLLDPFQGTLCQVEIIIESEEVVEISDDPVISEIQTPEFDGPDTICVSSNNVNLCLDSFPSDANKILWDLPGGQNVIGEDGKKCVFIENPVSTPGTYEICATAFNSIDTTNTVCKEFVFTHPKSIIVNDTICEGEVYSFESTQFDTEDLSPGNYNFQVGKKTSTPGCIKNTNINLNILESDGTEQVSGILCKGEMFSYKGFSTSLPQKDIVYTDPADSLPCRDYLINVDVIGFDVGTESPFHTGDSILVESDITKEDNTSIDFYDPDLEVNYAWKLNSSGRTISTEKDLIISQDSVNAFPDRFYCLDLTTNYLDGEKLCSFRSNCIQLEPTSIGEEAMHSFNIYPNPFSNEIIMENPNQIPLDFIQLSSLDGKVLFSESFKNQSTQQYSLNQVNDLKSGVYILEIISGDQKYQTKLIKE